MKLRSYVGGAAVDLSQHVQHHAAVVEVELDDHRTVQLVVDRAGSIHLRAWGNTPMLLGNWNKVGMDAELAYEPATCDEYGNRLK